MDGVTKRSGILPFSKIQMGLRTLFKINKYTEKDTYYMISLICGIKHTHTHKLLIHTEKRLVVARYRM